MKRPSKCSSYFRRNKRLLETMSMLERFKRLGKVDQDGKKKKSGKKQTV